jgi:ABC-type multidrug transport system ATPase subunit
MNAAPLISVRSLRKIYQVGLAGCTASVRALDDVTLEIGRGEVVALVGSERSGKTTLLRCASGLLTADAGLVSRGRRPDGLPVVVKYLEEPIELARLCSYDSSWDLALVDNVLSEDGEPRGTFRCTHLIRQARAKGAALLLASPNGRSLEGLADRILTLHRGRLLHPPGAEKVAVSRVAEGSVHGLS